MANTTSPRGEHSVAQAEPSTPTGVHWTTRVHTIASAIAFMGGLNALIMLFTLCGGVVLGVAPALVAAAHCVREQRLGRLGRVLSVYTSAWRAEFVRANISLLPLLAGACVLGWNYLVFSVAGPAPTPQRIASLVALAVLVAASAWAVSISATYETPAWKVPLVALRLVVANPAASLVQFIIVITLAYASSWLGGLPVFLAFGAWAVLSTSFALHTFTENDARLTARSTSY